MSSLKNAAKAVSNIANPIGSIAHRLGVSNKNEILRAVNPAGLGSIAVDNVNKGYQEGGTSGAWNAIRRGDATDPGGFFHNVGGVPDLPDPGAPDQQDSIAAGYSARDRIRRLAYRAQGRSSTIKVSPSAAPFSGQPKQLIGQ